MQKVRQKPMKRPEVQNPRNFFWPRSCLYVGLCLSVCLYEYQLISQEDHSLNVYYSSLLARRRRLLNEMYNVMWDPVDALQLNCNNRQSIIISCFHIR